MDLDNLHGDLLYEEAFTPTVGTWISIPLSTPVVCTGEDLWVGYLIYQSVGGTFPGGVGCEPAVHNGNWIRSAQAWGHMSSDYNWNIAAILDGDPITHWLSADQMMGTVDPGASDEVILTFDATTLETGAYEAEVVVLSNDPENSSVSVPVTMNVNPVSVEELPADENFVIYPNPARDFFTVQANGTINQVKIYNYVGQLIDQTVVDNEKATLSTDGYQPGIYFIHVETAEGWSTRKVVIE